MAKVQLNVRVPAVLARRIKADAKRSRRSIDAVVETVFQDFFQSWTLKEREAFYGKAEPKRRGAPIEEVAP